MLVIFIINVIRMSVVSSFFFKLRVIMAYIELQSFVGSIVYCGATVAIE